MPRKAASLPRVQKSQGQSRVLPGEVDLDLVDDDSNTSELNEITSVALAYAGGDEMRMSSDDYL